MSSDLGYDTDDDVTFPSSRYNNTDAVFYVMRHAAAASDVRPLPDYARIVYPLASTPGAWTAKLYGESSAILRTVFHQLPLDRVEEPRPMTSRSEQKFVAVYIRPFITKAMAAGAAGADGVYAHLVAAVLRQWLVERLSPGSGFQWGSSSK